jgi:hypothetical protein
MLDAAFAANVENRVTARLHAPWSPPCGKFEA